MPYVLVMFGIRFLIFEEAPATAGAFLLRFTFIRKTLFTKKS